MLLFGVAWTCAIVATALYITTERLVLFDTGAYWFAWRRGALYPPTTSLNLANYIYPPPFAQLLWPALQLPWTTFATLWTCFGIAVYGWLISPLPLRLRLPAAIMLGTIVLQGNASFLVALALVIAIAWRQPAAWALPLLTKVAPVVGLAWYPAQREWRLLARAVGATVVVTAVSFAVSPGLWWDWVRAVTAPERSVPGIYALTINAAFPIWPRALLAVVMVLVAARKRKAWVLPVAVLIANPDIFGSTMGVLAAIPRLATVSTTQPPMTGARMWPAPTPETGPTVPTQQTISASTRTPSHPRHDRPVGTAMNVPATLRRRFQLWR